MNESLMWLIIVVVLVVSTPAVGSLIRKWDFNRQISGKKPMRSFKGNEVEYGGNGHDYSMEADAAESVTHMRSVTNVMTMK